MAVNIPIFAREKVIVSADDFGIRNTAEAILPLAKQGKVDRVSVLVNYMDSAEQARELLSTGVKIDLHLEIIDLINSGKEDRGNSLLRGINFFVRYLFGLVRVESVERSWVRQIERFRELFGRLPDGLNSHEHVHYFPKFFRIAMELGERYDIPFVRFSTKGVLMPKSSFAAYIIDFLWRRNVAEYDDMFSSRETSDFFVSYDWVSGSEDFFKELPDGRVEIVFHPERTDEYSAIERLF